MRLTLWAMLRPPHLHFGTHVLTFIHTSVVCFKGQRLDDSGSHNS